ncbi:MAG: hypothetical protein NFCOHLIN_00056 [Gammaproteobacteria bacterium]|nr:hypothetical protein [Gammaproteobacteria bacterium]
MTLALFPALAQAQSAPPRRVVAPPPPPPPRPTLPGLLTGLPSVNDATWDETAVRKVLQIFAYGGLARDSQITTWANMRPADAIRQMLTLGTTNNLLSPSEGTSFGDGTLTGVSAFLSGASSPIPDTDYRADFEQDAYNGSNFTWMYAATLRGLNPFRQKMGLFETNYHLAVHRRNLSSEQLFAYYDRVLSALAASSANGYETVMTTAALSAAVARQYGHDNARFNRSTGECYCNEDFAREYHQLFFGILALNEPDYHENTTIKNTAKALTDMNLYHTGLTPGTDPEPWAGQEVQYQSDQHPAGTLDILHNANSGTNAQQRFVNQAAAQINHPESLDTLPVMIVQVLADDNLSNAKKAALRQAWRSMARKDILLFLQAYAISTLFHDPLRVKYLNSFDRHLNIANKTALNNNEQYAEWPRTRWLNDFDQQRPFEPMHEVFGGQTGEETSKSAYLFQSNYDNATENGGRNTGYTLTRHGLTLTRNWASVVPATNGTYSVRSVAEWLWQRYVSDGRKNLGPLERAHLYALLATGNDLAYAYSTANPDRVITATDLTTDAALAAAVNGYAAGLMNLNSNVTADRTEANRRVGQAINFILATPFMLVQEGR